jgi:hypothetical protein
MHSTTFHSIRPITVCFMVHSNVFGPYDHMKSSLDSTRFDLTSFSVVWCQVGSKRMTRPMITLLLTLAISYYLWYLLYFKSTLILPERNYPLDYLVTFFWAISFISSWFATSRYFISMGGSLAGWKVSLVYDMIA